MAEVGPQVLNMMERKKSFRLHHTCMQIWKSDFSVLFGLQESIWGYSSNMKHMFLCYKTHSIAYFAKVADPADTNYMFTH